MIQQHSLIDASPAESDSPCLRACSKIWISYKVPHPWATVVPKGIICLPVLIVNMWGGSTGWTKTITWTSQHPWNWWTVSGFSHSPIIDYIWLYHIIYHFSSHISPHFLVLYNTSSRLVACTSHHPQGTKTTDLGKKMWGIWCHHSSEMVGYSLKLKHWTFPAFVFMEFTTSIPIPIRSSQLWPLISCNWK